MLEVVARTAGRGAGGLAIVLALTLAGEAPAPTARATKWTPPKPEQVTGVRVDPVTVVRRKTWSAAHREVSGAELVRWPAAGAATVDLPAAAAGRGSGTNPVPAGTLPVRLAPAPHTPEATTSSARPRRVGVAVLDRAAAGRAGVAGLVLTVNRADGVRRPGTVAITVDYRGLANASGGDWASRLRLVTLPGGKPLPTENNVAASTLTARVPLAADGGVTTLAATAGASSDNGDYAATSLSPASTWQVSQQTGDFTWSYPLRVPPAVGGPEPSLALGYSSGSVDGRTGGTNTQGSWIGDGWDLWPGFIERSYRSCPDDKDAVNNVAPNNANVSGGDQCWFNANATLSLNGRSTELVRQTDSRYYGVTDDGSKVELLKDDTLANGDDDNEYWKVTTVDGTQYFFGRHHGVGGVSATPATNAVWTTRVYGNHPNEPGYVAGNFAASSRTQAWRWNLDHVVDPHGNTMTYFYERETGAYGREGDPAKRTTYHRGGWLSRIEYGNRGNAAVTTYAAAKVVFDVADRCASNCYSGGLPVPASWPDTPWDQYCREGGPCTDQLAPTFWTGKRLAGIRTQVYSGSGSAYTDVESWTLRHTYLASGNNEGRPMWLVGLTRTGKVTSAGGGEVSDPEIVFDPGADPLANRVDGPADNRSSLYRYRINTITTESGAQISVTYSAPECSRSALPTPDSNTKRCFPQYYAPEGETPTLDWFHRYVVTRVDVGDRTGGFNQQQTNYDYLDSPAWHHDDSELVPPKKRTWGQYRGYGLVRVRTGVESGVQSATEYRYFRGMHGDKLSSGGTRNVSIRDSQGVDVQDHPAYSGMLREETVLDGAGGTWLSGTINTPVIVRSNATAGPLTAWMTNIATTRTRIRLLTGATRWIRTDTDFNAENLPTEIDDLGDESTPADDTCTRVWYARNAGIWLLDLVKKTEAVAVNCAATPMLPGDMMSSTRTTYDNETNNWDTYQPLFGNVAKIEEIGSWSGSTPVWVTTGRSRYDANGRVTEAFDALGRRTATVYTPTLTGPVTSTTVTNPKGHTITSTQATAWQLPTSIVDNPNNARTDLAYDGLGRLLKVWLPGRPSTSYPSMEFTYQVRNTAPTAVITKTLLPTLPNPDPAYRTSITLLDGLLRQRQTQLQAPGGGRVITDTVHDSRGLVASASVAYYDASGAAPGTTLVVPSGQVPARTDYEYDGAGRQRAAVFTVNGIERWRTTTAYGGDRTTVVPPAGGTKTETLVDARGRTTELRQYHSRTATTYDLTRYTHTDRGELDSLTDPAGNTWRYGYDQRGRKVRDEDPDKGVTTFTYDAVGQLATTTDARGSTLAYTYDELGRRTTVREDSVNGNKRAEWVYDTLPNGVGRLTRSIRYEPAGSTSQYVNEITGYDGAGRPTGNRVTVPTAASDLCAAGGLTPCTYTYGTTYRPDGQVDTVAVPAAAGLPGETLRFAYNDVGAPDYLFSAAAIYVASVTYNKLGQLTQRILGQGGKRLRLTRTFDEHTGRLSNANAVPDLKPFIFDYEYSYDDAGNLTRIADVPAGGPAEAQCYRYDHLRRTAEAWTPASRDCGPAPTVAGLGGPAPYWHSFTYDTTGNRRTEVQHGTTNTTRTYSYPAAGGGPGSKPHAVTQVVTTGATSRTQAFAYDETGNTTCRPAGTGSNTCPPGTGSQTLTWDREGRLATNVNGTATTRYVYDADGNRLIRRDPGGATLYLPDGTEIRKPSTGTATGTRYYAHAGTVVAVRTSAGLTWLANDHHDTGEATVASADLAVTRRRTLPFGGLRGTAPGSWAGDKGFVGGTMDNTGLTHLGAREYDPATGRFISVDPVLDPADPQQLNGYAYANNSPASSSDPDGLLLCGDDDCRQRAVPKPGGGHRVIKPPPPTPKRRITCYDGNQSAACGGPKRRPISGGHQALPHGFVAGYGADNHYYINHVDVSLLLFVGGAPTVDEFVDGLRRWLEDNGPPGDGAHDAVERALWLAIHQGYIKGSNRAFTPRARDIMSGRLGMIGGLGEMPMGGGRFRRSGCNSFIPETPVLMADGGTKPIRDVAVGDLVLATDPETGETAAKQVSALIDGEGEKHLVRITVDTDGEAGQATASVTATDNHPFWVPASRKWLPATLLQPGQWLRTSAGTWVQITAITRWTQPARVHNLTVADIHTFYVQVGTTSVLVHNCPDDVPGAGPRPLTPNQMNQAIRRGNAPPGFVRVDVGRVPGEQVHIHLTGGRHALNRDGSWKHGGRSLAREEKVWLRNNGWTLPEE